MLLIALAALLTSLLPATSSADGRATGVIVQATDTEAAAHAVRSVGGTVRMRLPIVSGVSARVPLGVVDLLSRRPGVRAVTPDERVVVQGSTEIPSSVKSVYPQEVNADRAWERGYQGRGVRVALIDTGVSPVPDIDDRLVRVLDPTDSTKTVDCVDFSGEGTCNDTYGHGTFVAGLIAGTGDMSGGRFRGIAPQADIISIKIGGKDGSADVTKVLAAIQWVVSFRERYGIKVLNLSLGTDSKLSYKDSPLNLAVERAWDSGIVVVVAASNRGPASKTISKPGDDPLVITVGAVDDRETPAIDDDRLPAFSGRGPTIADGLAKPDVVAPGGRVISLRAGSSTIDARFPKGLNDWYRRGSGTSMAAGVVSGVVALVLQQRNWSPDRVKFALTSTARKVAERDPSGVGHGLVDAHGATSAPSGVANVGVVRSNGLGSLEATRNNMRVTSQDCLPNEQRFNPTCAVVDGEETARGTTFDAEEFANGGWNEASWYEGQWNQSPIPGVSWYTSEWYGVSWYEGAWTGSSWYGNSDSTNYGTGIPGSSWYGVWE